MHLAPVFTRKLALMPFDLANPVWIHDDDIDLDYHVRYMVLPKPGTLAQLEALAARLHSMPARPQPAALGVLHHRGPGRRPDRLLRQGAPQPRVDGQAGVAMATSMFDVTARAARGQAAAPGRAPTPTSSASPSCSRAALQNQARQVVERPEAGAGAGEDGRRRGAEGAPSGAAKARGPSRAQGREGARRASSSRRRRRSTHSITNQRSFAAVSLPLAEIKAIGKAPRRVDQRHGAVAVQHGAAQLPEGQPRAAGASRWSPACRSRCAQEGDTTHRTTRSPAPLIDLGTDDRRSAERLKAIKRGTAAMKKQMGTFGGVIPTDFPSPRRRPG